MFDPGELALPPLGLLRRYLVSQGWSREALPGGALELFTLGVKSQSAEIVLGNVDPADTAKRVLQALRTLSGMSGVPVERLARDVSMFDFDVMRTRLPDALVLRDSISLRVAERFIANARRFLTSAAAAEISRLTYVANTQQIGADYADRCRFAHTFHGSFGFTIESPAGTSAETLDGAPSPRPVERRIVERIASGLADLQLASIQGSAAPLIDGAPNGFNINMLQDFQTWLANSTARSIRFDFALTPAWPTLLGQRLSSNVQDDVLPLIEGATAVLRPPEVPTAETIVGKIVLLESREVPTDLLHEGGREIGVEGESSERGPLTLRVRLDAKDYLNALDAHRTGRHVKVVGIVKRTGRGSSIADPSAFSVL